MDKNIISFVATAEEYIEQDFLSITFSGTETGSDAYSVQTALAERQRAALEIARPKQSETVEVKSGSFYVYPTYGPDNVINGYSGTFIIIVSGTDTPTITELTGEITSATVANVQQSVSDERRREVQKYLALRAIQNWREKATAYTEAFGEPSYTLVSADININRGYPIYAMSAKAESAGGGEISTEPGKEEVTVTVTGSIQLDC